MTKFNDVILGTVVNPMTVDLDGGGFNLANMGNITMATGKLLTFASGEYIYSDGTDLKIRTGADIHLIGSTGANIWNIQATGSYCYQPIWMSNNKYYRGRTTAGTAVLIAGISSGNDLVIGQTTVIDDIYMRCSDWEYHPAIAAKTTGSSGNVWIGSTLGEMARSTSSIVYKTNVTNISESPIDSSKIYDLRPITFTSLCDIDDQKIIRVGLIAEEVELVLPSLVEHEIANYEGKVKEWITLPEEDRVLLNPDTVGTPINVQYPIITVLLLEEMKKLRDRIETIEKEIHP